MIGLRAIPWRLIGFGAIALAVGLLLWRVGVWRTGYLERDKAVADLAAYGDAVAAREKQEAKDREDAAARSATLALTVETARATIELLRANPIQSVVYVDKPAKDGKCADPRVGPDWIRVYNETADAASRAVSRPD